jgi:hypothetical protein
MLKMRDPIQLQNDPRQGENGAAYVQRKVQNSPQVLERGHSLPGLTRFLKLNQRPSVVVHTCNPSTLRPAWFYPPSEILSQKKKKLWLSWIPKGNLSKGFFFFFLNKLTVFRVLMF